MRLHKKETMILIDLWLQSDPMVWATFSDSQKSIHRASMVQIAFDKKDFNNG